MVFLLDESGSAYRRELSAPPCLHRPRSPLRSRAAYAAAHVVPRVSAENVPGAPPDIDWDATLGFRHHVWSWGLGVADAMDTAQRNMGLDPVATGELIRRSAAEARTCGGRLVVGVNTDHVDDEVLSLQEVIDAYAEQLHFAEDQGAGVVLMASRHLARVAESPADYARVYRAVLARASSPVVLHWLGEAFDPHLAGYFGSRDIETAMDVVVDIIGEHSDKVHGIKLSLLDAGWEVALRARLPAGVRLFTGDDYNYVGLIEGDGSAHSDALLGAFAAIAPNASAAIQALDAGDFGLYEDILGPTQELARQLFASPTPHYKAGVAFLAWMNGHQPAHVLVGGLHSARSLPHLSELLRLADEAGALQAPELAQRRWHALLAAHDVPEVIG